MKKNQSGSGVKAAKVVSEVLAIINDSTLSTARKIRLLSEVQTAGRPGADQARELIASIHDPFVKKYEEYLRKTLVSIPCFNVTKRAISCTRGLKYEILSKNQWTYRFNLFCKKEANKAVKGISYYPYEIVKNIIGSDPDRSGLNYFVSYHSEFGPACKPIAWKIIQEVRRMVTESNEKNRDAIEFYEKTGLSEIYLKHIPSIPDFIYTLSRPWGYICLKGFYINAYEREGTDWNYYSKAWHRAHGPKRWIESRGLHIHQPNKGQIASIPVERWGAKNIVEALAGYFKLQKQPYPKGRKPVQMNDYFTIRLDHRINGYEIYERLFADTHVDWCIFDTKTKNTYHSAKQEELVPGLRNKLQAKLDREFETITKATGFTLGFCETGMRNFCDDNDLDFDGEYSRRDLRNIVIKKRELNYRKYRSELAKIGITLSSK